MNDFLASAFFPRLLYNLAAILLIAALWKLNTHVYKKLMKPAENNSLRSSVLRTVYMADRYAILLMGTLTLMQINGINVTSIITGLGIASAVVGFAIQEPLRDVISGLQIVTDHFFKTGDVVEYSGKRGIVISFSIRSTKIRLLDSGQVLTVSNRNISEIIVVPDLCLLDIPLPYSLKTEEASSCMSEISRRIEEETEASVCRYTGIQDFADSAVIHRLQIEADAENQLQISRECRRIVSLVLEERGISIPFNQLDVHLDPQG